MVQRSHQEYNRHIEQCNRAIEASEAGDARPGWGETQADNLKRNSSASRVTSKPRRRTATSFRKSSGRKRLSLPTFPYGSMFYQRR